MFAVTVSCGIPVQFFLVFAKVFHTIYAFKANYTGKCETKLFHAKMTCFQGCKTFFVLHLVSYVFYVQKGIDKFI